VDDQGPAEAGHHSLARPEEPQTQPTRGVLSQIDLADSFRILSGLGASAWMRSPWWFLGAMAYNIVGEPFRDFLQDIRQRVGPAIGEVLAEWIRNRQRSPSPHNDPSGPRPTPSGADQASSVLEHPTIGPPARHAVDGL
jgi:hypothetical protein